MIRYSEEYRKRFESAQERNLYQQEKLLFEATELISRAMLKENISKADLSKRIGKSKAYVTQVLKGKQNMTLKTLSELAWALGYTIELGALKEETHARVNLGAWAPPLQTAVMELVGWQIPTSLSSEYMGRAA